MVPSESGVHFYQVKKYRREYLGGAREPLAFTRTGFPRDSGYGEMGKGSRGVGWILPRPGGFMSMFISRGLILLVSFFPLLYVV